MADEISIHDSVTSVVDEITYDDSKKEAIEKEWLVWLKDYENHSNWIRDMSCYEKLQNLMYQSVEGEYWKILIDAYEKVPLARKARMPSSDQSNQTALHLLVARSTPKQVIEEVLRHVDGDDVKIRDKQGNTILHTAASAKGIENIDIFKLILSCFPDLIEERDNKGKTALSLFTSGLIEDHDRGDWNTAVDGYEAMINTLNVTTLSPHSTPLHMAVRSFWNEEDVKKTFEKVKDKKNILKIKDEKGKTALHLAAKYILMEDACKSMADVYPELINEANCKGETPLFIAAISYNIHNYRILYKYADSNTIDRPRSDGNTILHCALLHEDFDMAYHILQEHPSFGSRENKDGLTPLKILANIPSAFRSRTPLTMVEHIIYSCIWVVDLEKPRYNEVDYCRQALSECFKPVKRLIMSGSQTMQKVFSSRSCYLGDTKNPKDESESAKDLEKPDHKQIIEEDSLTDSGSTEIEGSLIMQQIKFLIKRNMAPIKSFITTCMTPFMIIGKFARKIENIKRRHMLAYKIMEKLLLNYDTKCEESSNATILMAAEKGVTEMVEGILRKNRSAANCKTADGKSTMLLSIENRQTDVYELLTKRNWISQRDDGGNNALHLAATRSSRQPWGMPKTMQLLWEIKWYNYVRDTMPDGFSIEQNKGGKTPSDVFLEEHKDLIEKNDLGEWLNKTSQSCSVVAGLVATVAYSSATTIPGGNNQEGVPYFKGHPAFGTFVISAFIALCFSLISLIMFLTVLMSPYLGVDDANKSLPTKLVVALFSLLVSIGTMLVSFCAGHFFFLKGTLTYAAAPFYAIGCLVIAFLLITQFNSYTSLMWSLSRRKPRPWYDRNSIERVIYAA